MFNLKRNIPERQIYVKAFSLGIPSQITKPFLADVLKWETASGIEWTVSRLKSVKQDLINFYNNNSQPMTPWVRKGKDGFFNGYLGQLFRYSLQSFKCFTKSLSLLNIYTSYIFEKPREDVEIDKFSKAVKDYGQPTPKHFLLLVEQAAYKFRCSWKPSENSPFELCLTTPNREDRFMKEPRQFFRTSTGIYTWAKFGSILEQSMTSFVRKGIADKMSLLMGGHDDLPPYIGEIHCTPNPGLKARFFASPHLWLQHALEPLGNMIYDKVKSFPWDCTFEQSLGDDFIKAHLSKGLEAHCFDLTSATDRFPFDLQLTALRSLFEDSDAKQHIDFYEHMQKLPYLFQGKPLVWHRGQALGMYPSFGTFTLTHGLLLFALNNFSHDNKFFVLGDDVIILDDDLAKQYSSFLVECDIAFSPQKTIVSSRIAEFAGMMYSASAKVRIPKWKPLSKQNCLEQIGQWGTGLIDLMPRKVKPLLERVSTLPYPYGCGINPKGLSLDERFLNLEDIFTPEEKDLGFATNFRSLVRKRFLNSKDLQYESKAFAAIHNAEILDQRIQALLNEYKVFIPQEIAGKNLYTINPNLDLPLSIVGVPDRNLHKYWSSNLMRFNSLINRQPNP